jgi:co-chaperonin GroES (HSP10)
LELPEENQFVKILGKRILISPVKSEKSAGGIFLPDATNPDSQDQEGIVMAIGSDIKESLPYKKGSHVFLAMYSGMEIEVNGKRAKFVNQDDICGVMAGDVFRPCGDRILLKPIKTVARDSKIIRPSAYEVGADDGLLHCTVHLLGNGVRNKKGEYRPFAVKIGDKVLIKPLAGRDVDAAECSYKLVKQTDIEAIYE